MKLISTKYYVFGLMLLINLSITAQVPKNLSLVSSITMPNDTMSGCWHYEDSLGHPYALVGAYTGIAIISLDTPATPRVLFQLPGNNSWWHEVKVIGKYAYAVSEGRDLSGVKNGLQIINLSYLPDSAPYVFYQGDGAILNQFTKAHSVTAEGHYVYINGHNITNLGRGVLICDIADPMNPQYVGAITQNYCHDSYVRGDTIWTSDINAGMFSVYDISDRANPIIRAQQPTPFGFNHNAWLSDNSQYLFTTDERPNAPLAAFDVSDLTNITLKDQYLTVNMPSEEVHNVRVLNDFLINASYGSQVTIVDAAYPDNLIEIGNYPTGNSLCWDADPFLSSELLLATDMYSCTFYVLQPNYIRACYLRGNVVDSITASALNGVAVLIITPNIQKSTDPLGNYKTGVADSGFYDIRFSKTGYVTKIIQGVQLQNGIQTFLDVKLVPVNAGIENTYDAESISVSPNPFDKIIYFSSGKTEIQSARVFDSNGRLIETKDFKNNLTKTYEITSDKFSSGIYFLELNTSQSRIIKKIMCKQN